MQPQVTLLMCSERSGSNLITRMMGAHPEVCSPTPTHVIRVLAENRCRYGDLQDDANWDRMLGDVVDLLQTQLGQWQKKWTASTLHNEVTDRTLVSLVRHLFFAEAEESGCNRLFIKENHIYRYFPLLQRAFPDLQIVHLVRDPRDMALSWKRSSILRGDVVRAAKIWQEDQKRGLQLVGELAGSLALHQVRYEDLVSDSKTELDNICHTIGLTSAEEMVNFHRKNESVSDSARTSDWENLGRPVMSANFGKYRKGLNTKEIALIEAICGETMAAFGYACDINDAPSLSDLEAELVPLERDEKPGWSDVCAEEKELRRARVAVLTRIANYPLQSLMSPSLQGA